LESVCGGNITVGSNPTLSAKKIIIMFDKTRHLILNINPAKMLFLGYFFYILIGWGLLSLPLVQTQAMSSLDTLFTAASAVSTTGLVTIDIGTHYNFFGEFIILMLIQIGGIGFMTFGSFIIISSGNTISELRKEMGLKSFSLPKDFNISHFLRWVIIFTLVIEVIGAIFLYLIFSYNHLPIPVWSAIFHSVSAFCTAGFSLFNNNLEGFANNTYLNIVIGGLSYLGAIGFIVMADLWHNISGQRKNLFFTSKVILKITMWFLIAGVALFYTMEPSIQVLPHWERLLVSFFQVMSASTTVGFNTIPLGTISASIMMFLFILMTFGASPSGTGGGLKSTTLAALLGVIRSTLKGRSSIRFYKREIPQSRIQMACAAFTYYLGVVFLAMFLLLFIEQARFEAILFEVVSALGTVGLSVGLTPALSHLGKIIVIVLMFMGRVGVLTFGMAISSHDETREEEADNELVL